MAWKTKVNEWLTHLRRNDPLRTELENIAQDTKQLEDCFYKDLEFGTGGMRGIIGPGTNRMNIYTIRKAAAGLAEYIASYGDEAKKRGLAIAYDTRHMSKQFAIEVAKTVGKYDIRTYVFREPHATPLLSFAVRYLKTVAGVVITASHNPPEYNGFKVYGKDGAQLLEAEAGKIIHYTKQFPSELTIEVSTEEELLQNDLLTYIGEEIDEAYIENLKKHQMNHARTNSKLNIVFTPLHGTAGPLVRKGLNALGFKNVHVVKEQEIQDPNFTTVTYPNPEEHAAFELAIRDGEKVNADILMATDPDADRLGVAVKDEKGSFRVLTGNQTGALILHYILEQRQKHNKLPENGVMIQTIVTSQFGKAVAKDFGVKTYSTLTGFKYIAEKIEQYHKSNERTFLFGYEESYGYLIHDFVRDKDAIQSVLLIAEMAAFYKEKGMSLYDALQTLFQTYGYYKESLQSVTLPGKDGAEQIAHIMETFRKDPIESVNGVSVLQIEDYLTGEAINVTTGEKRAIHLPTSNVLKFTLADDSWFCIRPSGTEPKCKFYFAVKGETNEESEEKLRTLEHEVMNLIQQK